jgi:predicted ATP-binding protein involved in virulence
MMSNLFERRDAKMKISKTKILGLGGIESLELSFDRQMNIICGPNGVGKSTILDAISHAFAGGKSNLKRNVNSDKAIVTTVYEHLGELKQKVQNISHFSPQKAEADYEVVAPVSYLIAFKTNRIFNYQALDSVTKDPDMTDNLVWESNKGGISSNFTKSWFVNRYLYSVHDGAVNDTQRQNFELAKKCFSSLDSDFAFSRVDASSNEIMVSTPSGEIYYEYLSSGFKSCLSIMFAIIREVEFRFGEQKMPAAGFDGAILIDELELHLHPIWQSKICNVLTEIFPAAQFIVTTHSPHIIQSADPNQIKVLQRNDGRIEERQIPTSKYGFKGWTLDEVLTDVMGMEDTRSEAFTQLMAEFEAALEKEDRVMAENIYRELDLSLHPNNHARKLLKLQISAIMNDLQ